MEAMARALLAFVLLSAAEVRLASSQAASTPLQNVTLWKYGNATISCTTYPNVYLWVAYIPTRILLYKSDTGYNANPSRYLVANGSSTLTVMNVGLPDGGAYCCQDPTQTTESCSNLLVIDSLVPTVTPSTGLSPGSSANISCLLTYNSPTTDAGTPYQLSQYQDPELSILVGSNDLTESAVEKDQVVGSATVSHTKYISVNWTAVNPNGAQLICRVSSNNPAYSNSTSMPLNVYEPATIGSILFPNNATTPSSTYSLNPNSTLNITCNVNGYPPPTIIQWINVTNNNITASSVNSSTLVWTVQQKGFYNVLCSAMNTLSQNASNSTTYQFTVVDNSGGSGNSSASSSNGSGNALGLGLGLGIGLGVPVLIGVIILIVLLRKREQRSQPYAVKQPETKSKPQSTGTGLQPVSNGRNPEPGPRNNVNPNPNPTYQNPVMPEQTGTAAPQTVRDSPGYGDLGVKQIGGSGSNPRLNESYNINSDRSFDSVSHRPSGGAGANLQFKAGRAGNSPAGNNTSV